MTVTPPPFTLVSFETDVIHCCTILCYLMLSYLCPEQSYLVNIIVHSLVKEVHQSLNRNHHHMVISESLRNVYISQKSWSIIDQLWMFCMKLRIYYYYKELVVINNLIFLRRNASIKVKIVPFGGEGGNRSVNSKARFPWTLFLDDCWYYLIDHISQNIAFDFIVISITFFEALALSYSNNWMQRAFLIQYG